MEKVQKYKYGKHNVKKYIYLTYLKNKTPKSCRTIAEETYKKFSHEVSPERHFHNTIMCMYRYCKYKRGIVKRKKVNGVFVYSLSERGKERLKQLIVVKAFFGIYRLNYYGVQLLLKNKYGKYSVNPDVIEYVPLFCDADSVKLWQHV